MADDFVQKVRGASPFPWRHEIHANGRVIVFDATGKEVPLFTLTDFACFISGVMSKQQKEAA